MTDYDDPPTENGYYDDTDATQLYFHAHRERRYAYWRAKAQARCERRAQYKVDEVLE